MIRRVTLDLARKFGFCDADLTKIEMAVDEACANAILYQSHVDDSDIDLKVDLQGEVFAVTLIDRGCEFDFNSLGRIDLEEQNQNSQEGGLGVFIIRKFMDEVFYEHREGQGNVLRMVKFRSSPSLASTR